VSEPHKQQLALIEAESDEALLLPDADRRKRYTAGQARQIEWKLDCILAMLACGVIPLETIAARAHVNFRIVQELSTRYAERIGSDAIKFSDYAAAKAAKFLYLADQKSGLAGPKDLMIMHGIARDTAINLRLSGGGGSSEPEAIDITASESDALKKFRAGLKQITPERPNPEKAAA